MSSALFYIRGRTADLRETSANPRVAWFIDHCCSIVVYNGQFTTTLKKDGSEFLKIKMGTKIFDCPIIIWIERLHCKGEKI